MLRLVLIVVMLRLVLSVVMVVLMTTTVARRCCGWPAMVMRTVSHRIASADRGKGCLDGTTKVDINGDRVKHDSRAGLLVE